MRLDARPSPAYDVPLVVGDATEAAALLGWKPQITLEQGIASTIAWGREAFAK